MLGSFRRQTCFGHSFIWFQLIPKRRFKALYPPSAGKMTCNIQWSWLSILNVTDFCPSLNYFEKRKVGMELFIWLKLIPKRRFQGLYPLSTGKMMCKIHWSWYNMPNGTDFSPSLNYFEKRKILMELFIWFQLMPKEDSKLYILCLLGKWPKLFSDHRLYP